MYNTLVTRRTGRTGPILVQYLVIVILLLAALIYHLFPSIPASDAIYLLSLALLGLTIWSLWSWRAITDSVFDFYVMFFLAALIFNGGHALLEILHLNPDGILGGQFPDQVILHSLFTVVLGLACFHFGALLVARRRVRNASPRLLTEHTTPQTTRYLRVIGWSLLLVSIVPSYVVLREALRVSLSEGYFALYQQQSVTGFAGSTSLLAKFLTPGALFLLAGSKGRPFGLAVSGLVMLAYTAAYFILGSRIEAAAPLLAYAWLWHRQIRPLPVPLLLVSAVGLLGLVFPFIKATRNLTAGAKLDPEMALGAFAAVDNPLVAIISEMGSSFMTVAHTIQLVPAARSFDGGLSYIFALFTVFPNLFWDIHPTIARGLAADWLVKAVSPSLASVGGGYGFSFIAEAYLNFGWIGITLALALIGALLARVAAWAQKAADPSRLALAASFGAFFLVFARGESGSIVRELVWYALGPFLLVRLLVNQRLAAKRVRAEPVTTQSLSNTKRSYE